MSTTDADQVLVDAINRESGESLVMTGRATEGTSGSAIFVDLADGQPGVVTHFLGSYAHAVQTAGILEHARSQGLPVPRHHRVIPVGPEILVIQERIPGEPPTKITTTVLDAVVEVNERFARILADRHDVPTLPLCLTDSGHPYPRHEVLAEHSSRSRRILHAIHGIGQNHPGDVVADDLLHVDLDLSNVLFNHDGEITGVVDWNLGAYRGDRHLALVKTRFEQEWALHDPAPDPGLIAAAKHLDELLTQRVPPADLRRYWASRLLYQLHWILQSGPLDVVDWHLSVAEARLL